MRELLSCSRLGEHERSHQMCYMQGEMADAVELNVLETAFRSLLITIMKTLPTRPPLAKGLSM